MINFMPRPKYFDDCHFSKWFPTVILYTNSLLFRANFFALLSAVLKQSFWVVWIISSAKYHIVGDYYPQRTVPFLPGPIPLLPIFKLGALTLLSPMLNGRKVFKVSIAFLYLKEWVKHTKLNEFWFIFLQLINWEEPVILETPLRTYVV